MIIGVNLSTASPYALGVIHGIFRYVKERPEIKLWMPHSSIINQRPPDSVDVMIGSVKKVDLPTGDRPVINVNSLPQDDSYQVCVDSQALCKMALEHFKECNIPNICFLTDADCLVSSYRKTCFEDQCRLLGIQPLGLRTTHDEVVSRKNLTDSLVALPKPLGILMFDDRFAPQLIDICNDMNLDVPHEVAVLGINNDIDICLSTRPKLTSIGLNLDRIGYEAARSAERLFEGERVPRISVIAPEGVVWRQSTAIRPAYSSDVTEVLDYMRSKLSEPLVMDDLVRQQSLGRRALEKAFQAEVGESPMHYLRSLRLERICYLLKTTDKAVSEIGRECGIPDANYLCQLFRRLYQTTPTAYRDKDRATG